MRKRHALFVFNSVRLPSFRHLTFSNIIIRPVPCSCPDYRQGNTGANPQSDPEGEDGPWVGADLECGMYYGGGNETKVNNRSLPLKHPFVTLYLRGRVEGMVLKGGDATKGGANNKLITMFDGERPDCAIADTCNRRKITLQSRCSGMGRATIPRKSFVRSRCSS